MDTRTVLRQFRHVVSLASLAYIFSAVHAIQYSLLDYDFSLLDGDYDMDDNDSDHNLQSTSRSDFTSTHDQAHDTSESNPANISSSSGNLKTNARWTDQEISLLLDYVEANCTLNPSSSGLSLKKSHFNKARDTVKTKDATKCHYKWSHVRIIYFSEGLFH
jgi:hypothetical protein